MGDSDSATGTGKQAQFVRTEDQEIVAYAFEAANDYSSDWTKRVEFEDPRDRWPEDKIRAVKPLVEK